MGMMRRRPIRRVATMAAVGGVGYYAGKKTSEASERKAQNEAYEAQAAQDQAAQAQAAQAQATQAQAQAAQQSGDDILDQIKKLGELHESGTLTDEEFASAKAKLLNA